MAIRHSAQIKTQASQHGLNSSPQFLRMLQSTRTMESQAWAGLRVQALLQRLLFQHFDQILGQFTDAASALGVGRIVLEQVHVLFHKSAATAGGLHYRYSSLFDLRPPGVDIAARL